MDNQYKRVWCLYRVSTKQQLYDGEDIPVQERVCRDFVKRQPNWEITRELYERGVSGWKTRTEDRDALNDIKNGAIKGEFDILLVFISDRLGRREDESPLIIEFLKKHNVTVWSTQEGELKAEDHTDKLINYIRFWQSSGESLKTSIRVKEGMATLNAKGGYAGGAAPFGYEIYETNEKHPKKDKKIKSLRVNEYEAKIVQLIFEYCVHEGLGASRIAKKLNDNGYKTRNNSIFRHNRISQILRNPIYIGKKVYNKYDDEGRLKPKSEWKYQPYNESLRIISDELFYQAQDIIDKRKVNNANYNSTAIPTPSKNNLLSGIVYCKTCGGRLKTDYTYKDYKRKSDGKVTRMKTYRYRCHRARNISNHGKSAWGAKTIDLTVANEVKQAMQSINPKEFYNKALKYQNEKIEEKEIILQKYEQELDKMIKKGEKLNQEIANALIGESDFSPKQLSKAIEINEKKIDEQKILVQQIKDELEYSLTEMDKSASIIKEISDWPERFDQASIDGKRAMLSKVIDKIELGSGTISINFNLQIKKLLKDTSMSL